MFQNLPTTLQMVLEKIIASVFLLLFFLYIIFTAPLFSILPFLTLFILLLHTYQDFVDVRPLFEASSSVPSFLFVSFLFVGLFVLSARKNMKQNAHEDQNGMLWHRATN